MSVQAALLSVASMSLLAGFIAGWTVHSMVAFFGRLGGRR